MLSESSAVLAEAMATAHLQRLAELIAADMHEPDATAPEVMDSAEIAALAERLRFMVERKVQEIDGVCAACHPTD